MNSVATYKSFTKVYSKTNLPKSNIYFKAWNECELYPPMASETSN